MLSLKKNHVRHMDGLQKTDRGATTMSTPLPILRDAERRKGNVAEVIGNCPIFRLLV